MIPGLDHWYACVAEPTPGMLRWDVARDRSRSRMEIYRALGAITRSMKMPDADTVTTAEPGAGSVIETAEGVREAGPDVPALAAATQHEENARAAAMQETVSGERAEAQWEGYRSRCVAEGIEPMSFQEWSRTITASKIERDPRPWPGAPVGAVSREQAGILPTGPMRVTDEMVERGFIMGQRIIADHTLERGDIRLVLEAALTGKGLDT